MNLERVVATRFPTAERMPGILMNTIRVDNVNLIVFGKPATGEARPSWYPEEMKDEFVATEDTAIDHIAFSFRDIRAGPTSD